MAVQRDNPALVYSDECRRRFSDPAHAGPPPDGTAAVSGRARGRGGDTEVQIWLARQGRRAWFLAHGCPWTIAGADLAAEWWSRGVDPLERPGELAAALEAPAERMDVFLTIEDAFRAARKAGGHHPDTGEQDGRNYGDHAD